MVKKYVTNIAAFILNECRIFTGCADSVCLVTGTFDKRRLLLRFCYWNDRLRKVWCCTSSTCAYEAPGEDECREEDDRPAVAQVRDERH